MSLRERNVNFRASEQTMTEIADIQKLFHPFLADRSSTLRWIIGTVWHLLFTDAKVIEAFMEWQVFLGNNGQRAATQMKLHFPPQDGYVFHPRFRGHLAMLVSVGSLVAQ